MSGRHAGVNVPLFSIRSSASWGIGELADVAPFSDWMASAGFDRLLVLPLGLCFLPGFVGTTVVPVVLRLLTGVGGLGAAAGG